jgi:hypothetical protein
MSQQRPDGPSILIGQSNRSNIGISPVRDARQPSSSSIGITLQTEQHRTCPVNQKCTQVRVAALADAKQIRLSAGGVLPGYESQPRGKLPAIVEKLRVPNACHQRACRKWTDSWDSLQTPASRVFAMPGIDFSL